MESTVSAHNNLFFEEVGDGIVVYDPRTKMAHVLNPAAAAVLLLCEGRMVTSRVVTLVSDQVGCPPDVVRPDVEAIISSFAREGLVDVASE